MHEQSRQEPRIVQLLFDDRAVLVETGPTSTGGGSVTIAIDRTRYSAPTFRQALAQAQKGLPDHDHSRI